MNDTSVVQSAVPQAAGPLQTVLEPSGTSARPTVPLAVTASVVSSSQPFTVGVPLPKGYLQAEDSLVLVEPREHEVLLQSKALARWSDDSVKWLLIDFVAGKLPQGTEMWCLRHRHTSQLRPPAAHLCIGETSKKIVVETGVATYHLDRLTFRPFERVELCGRNVLAPNASDLRLSDANRRCGVARVKQALHRALGANGRENFGKRCCRSIRVRRWAC